MYGTSMLCARRRDRDKPDARRDRTGATRVAVGQRVGGWVIHFPAVV